MDQLLASFWNSYTETITSGMALALDTAST